MTVQGEVRGVSVEGGLDRRRHGRNQLPMTAVVFRRDATLGRFVVQNLSAGGALLTGRHDVRLDEHVRILLALPGREPLVLQGRVARRASAPNQLFALAVQFRHLSPRTEDAIQEALVSALDQRVRAQVPAALVVQDSADLCARLGADIASAGLRVRIAVTPLDAVRWLEDPQERIEVAFIDVSVGDVDGLALMHFLAEEHPGVRRILVQGAVRPSTVELMQASRFVHGVVADPWGVDELREALGQDLGSLHRRGPG